MSGHGHGSEVSGKQLAILLLVALALLGIILPLNSQWHKKVADLREKKPPAKQELRSEGKPTTTASRIESMPEKTRTEPRVDNQPPAPIVLDTATIAIVQETTPRAGDEWILLDSLDVRCPNQLESQHSRDLIFYKPVRKKFVNWKRQELRVSEIAWVYFEEYGPDNGIENFRRELRSGTPLRVMIYKHLSEEGFHEVVFIANKKGGSR